MNADSYAAARLGIFFPGSSNGTMDDGDLTGQCVSLVKWFGAEMCQLPNPGAARGNAKDFGNALVNQGLAYEVPTDQRQQGDIIVWPQDGGGYGHIGVLLSGDRVFEQNVALPGSSARVVAGSTVYSSRIDPLYANWRRGGARFYRMRNYVGNRPAVSDEQIRQAYRDILEREADEDGINHYRSQAAKGWTSEQIKQDLLNSNERKQLEESKKKLAGNQRVVSSDQGALVRSGAGTSFAPVQDNGKPLVYDKGTVLTFKGYAHGQAVNGSDIWLIGISGTKYIHISNFDDTDLHDLPDLTPKQEPTVDYSKLVLDVSAFQKDDIVNCFSKFLGVIIRVGHVGESYGGGETKTDPKYKMFAEAARREDKLLGLYWLPRISTDEDAKKEAKRFANAIEKVGNVNGEILFVDLEPDFEGTLNQLQIFRNEVLKATDKSVCIYAGEAIAKKLGLETVTWYPNYSTTNGYLRNAVLHQYTSTGNVPGYTGNLDFSTTNRTLKELRVFGQKGALPVPEKPKTIDNPSQPSEAHTEPLKPSESNNKQENHMQEKPAPAAGLSKEEFEKMKKDNELTETEGWKPTVPDNVRLVIYLMGVVGIPVTVMTMSLLAVFGIVSYELSNQVSTIIASAVGTIASAMGVSHFTRGK